MNGGARQSPFNVFNVRGSLTILFFIFGLVWQLSHFQGDRFCVLIRSSWTSLMSFALLVMVSLKLDLKFLTNMYMPNRTPPKMSGKRSLNQDGTFINDVTQIFLFTDFHYNLFCNPNHIISFRKQLQMTSRD